MAHLEESSSQVWARAQHRAAELIPQASGHQCHQAGLDPMREARRLWDLYDIGNKSSGWREFGDVAFHLAAAYLPDLAYGLIYAFREIRERPDPVPHIMTALEHLYYLRPETLHLHLASTPEVEILRRNPQQLAVRGARILAREVSVAPYAHATGIYASWDPVAKPILLQVMREFNPEGAAVLSKGSKAWLCTGTGMLRAVLRTLGRLIVGSDF